MPVSHGDIEPKHDDEIDEQRELTHSRDEETQEEPPDADT